MSKSINTNTNNNTPHPNTLRTDEEMLDSLQQETFGYFLDQIDPVTGLIADKTEKDFPCNIAVVGMGIASYTVAVEKKFIKREDGIEKILKILRFFHQSSQGTSPDDTGYKGFYYHFLDIKTGKRVWNSELSTVDTGFLIAGMLTAAAYFTADEPNETEIRKLANELYERVDWQWALNKKRTLSHGWKPESGFLKYSWSENYSEAILIYMLAIGSPTHPISPEGYHQLINTFDLKTAYDIQYVYAGPLFIHQFSHLWIDFRGIHDDFNKKAGFDYFENSRRATLVHRQYAIENPNKFAAYGKYCWGQTASDGPGRHILKIDNKKIEFFAYKARGAPEGPDDGTVSPWAVVASLPFAPEIVIETTRHIIEKLNLKHHKFYGLHASFNATYPERNGNTNGWVSPYQFGLNQGPVVMMIENYQSDFIWKLMKQCKPLVVGLKKAGFSGAWL